MSDKEPFIQPVFDARIDEKIRPVVDRVEKIEGAFPDKDFAHHKDVHIAQDERYTKKAEVQRQWKKLWSDLFFDTTKAAVKGIAGCILALIVIGFWSKFNDAIYKAVDAPRAIAKEPGK